jgi:hypothetical protein
MELQTWRHAHQFSHQLAGYLVYIFSVYHFFGSEEVTP